METSKSPQLIGNLLQQLTLVLASLLFQRFFVSVFTLALSYSTFS
jgi:hypothetical protein